MAEPTTYSASVTLTEAAPQDVAVVIPAAGLTADVAPWTAKLTVDGDETPAAFTFDIANQRIVVNNLLDQEWPIGTVLDVSWSGTVIQAEVHAHSQAFEVLGGKINAMNHRLEALERKP
jgi:hypothetical protein